MTKFGSVVCILPDEEIGGRIIKQKLTYGKIYEVVTPGSTTGGKFYFIENDIGVKWRYWQSKFITLQEWRQKQLDLLIKN